MIALKQRKALHDEQFCARGMGEGAGLGWSCDQIRKVVYLFMTIFHVCLCASL